MKKPIEPNTEIPVTVTNVDTVTGTITFELPPEYGAASVQHHIPGMSIAAEAPSIGEIDPFADAMVGGLRTWTEFVPANAVEAGMKDQLTKACNALDNLLFVVNEKADRTTPAGRWWAHVIRATITDALEEKK